MKRTALPPRTTPLRRGTPLPPGGGPSSRASLTRTPIPRQRPSLPRQGESASTDGRGDVPVVPRPRKAPRRTGPDAATVRLIRSRDGGRCVVGVTCQDEPGQPLVTNHRTNRGMGGSSDPAVNGPAALISTCNPCNLWLEDNPVEAYVSGWKVRRPSDPSAVPVLYPDGWYLLGADGVRVKVTRSAYFQDLRGETDGGTLEP